VVELLFAHVSSDDLVCVTSHVISDGISDNVRWDVERRFDQLTLKEIVSLSAQHRKLHSLVSLTMMTKGKSTKLVEVLVMLFG